MNMNKKAQFEMIGLAIVVILIVLGMFIAIRLKMIEPPTNTQKEYAQTQLASNFLNTLILTNTDCGDRLMRELLIDCADTGAINCPDGKDSCKKADEIMDKILSQTLVKWQKKYLLTLRKTENLKIGIDDKSSDCNKNMERSMPGIYYYNLPQQGTLTVQLDLCY